MTLDEMKAFLMRLEDELIMKVMDAQDRAESVPGFESPFKDGEGNPICVPEDAAPNLDAARTHIQQAFICVCKADIDKEDQ